MTLTPTPEQISIIEAAQDTERNLLISALAGAAKTSTLVLIAESLPTVQMLCLAFNKKIAMEMTDRLPTNCAAMTLNSLGHRAWAAGTGRRLTLDKSKTYTILSELISKLPSGEQSEAFETFSDTMRMIDSGASAGWIPDEYKNHGKRLVSNDEFFSWLEEEPTILQERLIVEATCERLWQAFQGRIDFNDQILMPTVFGGLFPRYPLVLVDEAQDLSALNHAMLHKIARKRLIAVGDACHPEDTTVDVVKYVGDRWNLRQIEKIKIADLKIGDKVVGYDTEYSEFLFNRTVEGITKRWFSGDLVQVITKEGIARYTPNHHCFASFSRLRKHTALYLMRAGDRWRLGTAAMDYKHASGPIARARVEKADALWILATFKERKEALAAEAAVQAAFGIPDITFEWAGVNTNGYAEKEALAAVWGKLEGINFEHRAETLLRIFNRELDYPIWSPDKTYSTLKRPMVVHACNLLEGGEVLPFAGKKRERLSDWQDYMISHKPYEGYVYSLTVSHNHLYVADGVVTHNCQAIYGFRGAHEDSMTKMRQEFDMQELGLTISFRCPRAVVCEARFRAPYMQWPEWAKEGEVRSLSSWSADEVPDNSTIICRNNAPLFSMAIRLLKAKRYPELVGNDIGKALLKVLEKFGDPALPRSEVLESIRLWREAKLAKSRDKAKVHDQASCLTVFANEGETLGDAIAYAKYIFSMAGPVKLMTGHKAKGLEFDEVFFLDEHLIGDRGQERNLRYVIITRAKQRLTYVTSEGWIDA